MSTAPKKPHKHADTIKAWADGSKIECLHHGHWVDCFTPSWTEYSEYRVKPDPTSYVPESDVIDAEFDPGFQEVKDGASYRWMGSTAREWQEISVAMERLAEFHANEADKYQRMLRATERNFKSVQVQCTAAVQRYQSAEHKIDVLHELAPRSCRALAEFLGKTREEVSHEVITAIVLLERSKP